MADLKNIMAAAQRMQEGIKEAQDKLKQQRVDINVGANAVKLTMQGDYKIENLEIDASARQHPDLTKMIISAVNQGIEKVTDNQKKQILELAKDNKSIPANVVQAYIPAIATIDNIVKAGPGFVQMLRTLENRAKKHPKS